MQETCPEKADLIIVAPATANTIGKIACGIDDTPVMTVVTTGLGEGIPLLIVPAMHEPMYRNPFVRENIERLHQKGITMMMPRFEEGKAKIPESQEILDSVITLLSKGSVLNGKKVLITVGRTVEYLDPVRVLANNSTGKMGIALAAKALDAGAEVTLVYGRGTEAPPTSARVIRVDTSEDMKQAVTAELKHGSYDITIAAAAVSDWKPRKKLEGKVSTHFRFVRRASSSSTNQGFSLRTGAKAAFKEFSRINSKSPRVRLKVFAISSNSLFNVQPKGPGSSVLMLKLSPSCKALPRG